MSILDEQKAARRPCAISRRKSISLHGLASLNSLRVLYALDGGERCVGELVDILGVSQPLISQQLQKLLACNLVAVRRSGRHVYYSVADQKLVLILNKALEKVCGT